MKEVTKKDLPEVSGGDFPPDGCIPYPIPPEPDNEDRTRVPSDPILISPVTDA